MAKKTRINKGSLANWQILFQSRPESGRGYDLTVIATDIPEVGCVVTLTVIPKGLLQAIPIQSSAFVPGVHVGQTEDGLGILVKDEVES